MNESNAFTYQTQPNDKKNKSKRNYPMKKIILVVLVVALIGAAGYLYYLKDKEVRDLRSGGSTTSAEYIAIIDKLKLLVTIPTDETPQVAIIDDPDKLRETDSKFYANAEVGQYLIILPKSQKAIIYDKDTNKIINFSLYSIKYELIPDAEIPPAEIPLTIEIRYVDGVTQTTLDTVVANLTKASTNYSVQTPVKATLGDYTGLNVYLLNQAKKPRLSQNIMAHTGTSQVLTSLPAGEAASTADVVIILGAS